MSTAPPNKLDCDVVVIGGGIAGASLGARLAESLRVTLIEAESQCGFHATGRSAAFWLESYGGPIVAQLTAASFDFLERPPQSFATRGFLSPRGAVHISTGTKPEFPESVAIRALSGEELAQLVPGIREQWRSAWAEPACFDIDVAGLHEAYLRQFRANGGVIRTDARMQGAERRGAAWVVEVEGGSTIRASSIVNAAGSWADDVARAAGVEPIGISPKRRTMVQLRLAQTGLRDLPLVGDVAGTFYFKGESDRSIWLSPHDEVDSDPCDAAPDEMAVATAIERLQSAVNWPVERVERRWAGLRSFAPDRLPVYGFDPAVPDFFWCAGQGGVGIQTAPAAADIAGSLFLGTAPPQAVAHIDPRPFRPNRFFFR